jgi:lipopolysaccharide transport protein LptA
MRKVCLPSLIVLTLGASLLAPLAGAIEPLKPDKGDTIVVQADLAWEDPDEAVTFYRGSFALRTPDWSVEANEATIFGPLKKPDRILLNGGPARIWVNQPENSKVVEGTAEQIEYLLSSESVMLSGAAELKDGENTISSESIHYDVAADSYSAGQTGRVKVSIKPESGRQP